MPFVSISTSMGKSRRDRQFVRNSSGSPDTTRKRTTCREIASSAFSILERTLNYVFLPALPFALAVTQIAFKFVNTRLFFFLLIFLVRHTNRHSGHDFERCFFLFFCFGATLHWRLFTADRSQLTGLRSRANARMHRLNVQRSTVTNTNTRPKRANAQSSHNRAVDLVRAKIVPTFVFDTFCIHFVF